MRNTLCNIFSWGLRFERIEGQNERRTMWLRAAYNQGKGKTNCCVYSCVTKSARYWMQSLTRSTTISMIQTLSFVAYHFSTIFLDAKACASAISFLSLLLIHTEHTKIDCLLMVFESMMPKIRNERKNKSCCVLLDTTMPLPYTQTVCLHLRRMRN